MRAMLDTYPSVVSAGRDLLTGCVKTTGLSHLEETAEIGVKIGAKQRESAVRCVGGKNDCSEFTDFRWRISSQSAWSNGRSLSSRSAVQKNCLSCCVYQMLNPRLARWMSACVLLTSAINGAAVSLPGTIKAGVEKRLRCKCFDCVVRRRCDLVGGGYPDSGAGLIVDLCC